MQCSPLQNAKIVLAQGGGLSPGFSRRRLLIVKLSNNDGELVDPMAGKNAVAPTCCSQSEADAVCGIWF